MRCSTVLLLVAAGCAQEITVVRDGGTGSPRDSGAVVERDGAVGTPRDGGVGTPRDGGVGTSRDGGVRDAGPHGPITWGSMTLPPNTRSVHALWGRSETELYAGTGSGALLLFDGIGWTKVWQEPSNHGINSIDGTPSRLFVASDSRLHVFEGDHTGTRTGYLVPRVRQIRQMAVRSETEAYVVASLTDGRGFYRYDGSDLLTVVEPTDIAELEAVAALDGQPIFVGGNGRLFRYEQATLTPETIEWPNDWDTNDIALFTFEGFGQVAGRVYAVGDRQMVFERGVDRVWRVAHEEGTADGELHAIEGVQGSGFAVGEWTSPGPILRVDDGVFTRDPLTDDYDLATLWPVDANTWYAAGWVSNGLDGVVLRGTR